jgi:hypothetical protein
VLREHVFVIPASSENFTLTDNLALRWQNLWVNELLVLCIKMQILGRINPVILLLVYPFLGLIFFNPPATEVSLSPAKFN